MIDDFTNWEALVGAGIATLLTFLVDTARRWVSKQIDFADDLRRKEAGLDVEE